MNSSWFQCCWSFSHHRFLGHRPGNWFLFGFSAIIAFYSIGQELVFWSFGHRRFLGHRPGFWFFGLSSHHRFLQHRRWILVLKAKKEVD